MAMGRDIYVYIYIYIDRYLSHMRPGRAGREGREGRGAGGSLFFTGSICLVKSFFFRVSKVSKVSTVNK